MQDSHVHRRFHTANIIGGIDLFMLAGGHVIGFRVRLVRVRRNSNSQGRQR